MRSTRMVVGLLAAVALGVLAPGVAQAGESEAAGGMGAATGETSAPAPDCPSLEGCYGYDQQQVFYDEVIELVEAYAADTYEALPSPGYWYLPDGRGLRVCEDVAVDTSFFYCPLNSNVYVGQDFLWELYSMAGDGAAAFAVAHEWGHHVQNQAGVFELTVDQRSYIASENQADCIGGAFLGWLRDEGILEDDDYDDINLVLPALASAEDDPNRDHGTLEERAGSTQYGLDNGIAACSAYFPQAPLVT